VSLTSTNDPISSKEAYWIALRASYEFTSTWRSGGVRQQVANRQYIPTRSYLTKHLRISRVSWDAAHRRG